MKEALKGKFMKNPEEMTTDELIELADELKGDMTSEWLKRSGKAKAVRAQ